jgi:hypothetical protein
MELYLFEKNFKHTVTALQKPDIIPVYKTDYNTFTFGATLSINGTPTQESQAVEGAQ